MPKCVLFERECTACGECDLCDLIPGKKCDNCGECINLGKKHFASIKIDKIILPEKNNAKKE